MNYTFPALEPTFRLVLKMKDFFQEYNFKGRPVFFCIMLEKNILNVLPFAQSPKDNITMPKMIKLVFIEVSPPEISF